MRVFTVQQPRAAMATAPAASTKPTSFRRLVARRTGPFRDVAEVETVPYQEPGPDEVRLINACGCTHAGLRDCLSLDHHSCLQLDASRTLPRAPEQDETCTALLRRWL